MAITMHIRRLRNGNPLARACGTTDDTVTLIEPASAHFFAASGGVCPDCLATVPQESDDGFTGETLAKSLTTHGYTHSVALRKGVPLWAYDIKDDKGCTVFTGTTSDVWAWLRQTH